MISAVIPAYNEESTLAEAVQATAAALARFSPTKWELIVVDDGSRDQTLKIGQQVAAPPHIRILRHEHNRGKGAAVRTGVLQSTGDAVLVLDADLSTRPTMLEAFIPILAAGADLVTGDRRSPGARIERPQSMLRNFMGGIYAAMARLVTGADLRDFNCGFKLMKGDAARSLLAECRSDGWVWDVEVVALAMRKGLEVKAVPVIWRQGDRTSVAPFRAALASLMELARLWFRLGRSGSKGH